MLRTRFAPSPTGNLHIGGARTAIFNYFYAKSMGGEFYLRIEDTDLERSKKEYEDEIINSMRWLGLDYDGELVYQSKRFSIYKEFVEKLISDGYAYYCQYTGEDLNKFKKDLGGKLALATRKCRTAGHTEGAVRFRVPDENIVFYDELLGEIRIPSEQIEDFVIMRASGAPTYNLTVVVDDATMGITHVIRGDDHVNNTPKQILLYRALGFVVPKFMHVPMILGPDKKKLSKRHGATAVSEYKKAGYLPEALVNYLVRLSWSYGDKELFSHEELVKFFKDGNFSKSSAVMSIEKLDWLNAEYIKNLSIDEFLERLKDVFVPNDIFPKLKEEPYRSFLGQIQTRTRKLSDVWPMLEYVFVDHLNYDEKLLEKYIKDEIKPSLIELKEGFKDIDFNNIESLEKIFADVLEKHNVKMRKLAQAVRVLLTNSIATPGIFDVIKVLGKDKVLSRLSV